MIETSRPIIFKGADKVLKISLVNPLTRKFINLTGVDDIKVFFQKRDGSLLNASLVGTEVEVLDAASGLIKITLQEADTVTLKVGKGLPVEVEIISNSSEDTVIGQNTMAIDVRERIS